MDMGDVERELSHAISNFKQWQKEARASAAWQENPQTKEMNQLAEKLESPPIQERLQRLEEGYAVHAAARSILDSKGIQEDNYRYFQGKFYRISQRGETLTISHKDREQPLYVATDSRGKGGIIEISQFNLTSQDREMVFGYVEYLKQQEQSNERRRQVERGGFELGD